MIADLKPYAEYKDSGLSWIGQVPGHWDLRQPRQIGALLKGVGGTKEDALPAGVPCIRYGELYTTHTYFVRRPKSFIHPDRAAHYTPLQYGDVLFAASGETLEDIGKSAVNLIVGTAVCGGDVIILRPTVPVHAPFLGYVMDCRPSAHQKATMGRGTTVKHIYPDEIKHLLVPFPPVSEQAAIVRFLDWANGRLTRAIRAKRKVIALLNEQKQAIIHRAVTRGLDPSVLLKPSGIPWLGDIPQHWEVRRLKHISPRIGVGLVINPSSYFVDEMHPAPVPILLGNNITPNGFRLRRVRHIGADDNRRLGASRLVAGDVVVVRVGAPGVAAVVPPSLDGCNCASVVIVRKHASFVSHWLAHVFNSPLVASQIDVVKYGAAQKQFNISHAVDFLLPVPPSVEQQEIVDAISGRTAPLDRAMQATEREIDLLREYRTRLVADVVTGKLDVREAAARLPDEAAPDTTDDDADPSLDPEAADDAAIP